MSTRFWRRPKPSDVTEAPPSSVESLVRAAHAAPEPVAKAAAARAAYAALVAGAPAGDGFGRGVPLRPGRPARPVLLPPAAMPRRRAGGLRGRIALLHAVAHIELNAIDLACDLVLRFAADTAIAGQQAAFLADWLKVADDEARHFTMLTGRLADLGAAYGDLPAHDGLWAAAEATAHDMIARLVIGPLVHEARGLDVTPAMIERLEAAGDGQSAGILRVILAEEVSHVAAGWRWLSIVAAARSTSPDDAFHACISTFYKGGLKPPFNHEARARAGLAAALYESAAREKAFTKN